VTAKGSYPGAGGFAPGDGVGLGGMAQAVQDCRGCDLYERATQAVFGRGSVRASVVLIEEQPGDAQDRAGEPFVGPVGKLLDRAPGEAGMSAKATHITNAVKHFRWRPDPRDGKRRIHERPDGRAFPGIVRFLSSLLAAQPEEHVEPGCEQQPADGHAGVADHRLGALGQLGTVISSWFYPGE
jgi:uracil-DNA glycosylase